VDFRAGLDAVEKIKISHLLGIEPRLSNPQPIALPTELSLFHNETVISSIGHIE
jgi:hypothetical protein